MVIRYQLYLSKVLLLHHNGTVVPVDLQGAMPVPRKPGLSDMANQVLQTEIGKWNLEKEGTQKLPSPLLT